MKEVYFMVLCFLTACSMSPETKARMILESALKDSSAIVRIHAAVGLGGEAGQRVLTEILHSADNDVVTAALTAALQNTELLSEPEICRACTSTSPSVREAAFRLVAAKRGEGTRDLLLSGTKDVAAGVREISYNGLAAFRDTATIKNGLRDADVRVRIASAKALGKEGLTGMPEFIREEMKKVTPDMLGVGIIAMAELGDTGSIPLFRALLGESAGEVRVDAAEALLILGDHAGVEVLKRSLHAKDPFLRIHAAQVFTRRDVPTVAGELKSAVGDQFVNVAVQALRALAAHHALTNREHFIDLLDAENHLVRIEAAAAYLRSFDGA